jgi:hypothetical protein
MGISPHGDLVATLSQYYVAGSPEPGPRLEVYASADLHLLQKGAFPPGLGRNDYAAWPQFPRLQFSPKGDEILVQKMDSYLNNEKPVRRSVDNVLLTCLKRELDGGRFRQVRKTVNVLRCRGPVFLRVTDWPRVVVWNVHLGAIEVLNVDSGDIVSRLAIGDDPILSSIDPERLEKPDIGNVVMLLQALRGIVVSSDGQFGIYVPERVGGQGPGYLRKIDLAANPPRIVATGKNPQGDLNSETAAVSGDGGAVFVAKDTLDAKGNRLPSRQIRVFRTLDLEPATEITASVNVDYLAASGDGQQLYVLDRDQHRVAVVDVRTGREVRVLDHVGSHPVAILAVPGAKDK